MLITVCRKKDFRIKICAFPIIMLNLTKEQKHFENLLKMEIMKKLSEILLLVLCVVATSCADHDDPALSPIDTSEVKISAKVDATPASSWLSSSEEMTVKISDVKMAAPKGVVIRNINLYNNGQLIISKPYSGETLEFKVPLNYMIGRVNFSIIGDLIQKDHRDAEILIEDNIQRIVFTQIPKFEFKAHVNVTVKSVSTSGEEYTQRYDVETEDGMLIPIPKDKLYWTPISGTSNTIELTLEGGADTWSSNSTLESEVTGISWATYKPNDPVIKLTIPNEVGSLDNLKVRMDVNARFFGSTDNVTIEPQNLSLSFFVRES